MAILSKKDIFSKKDVQTKTINVPEWDGEVIISTMSGFARDKFEASILNKKGTYNPTNIRAKLVAASVVDEKGELLFNENDLVKLGGKSCAALDRIFIEAQKLNGLGDAEVEELAKN